MELKLSRRKLDSAEASRCFPMRANDLLLGEPAASEASAAEAAAAQMQAAPGSLVERLHRLEGQRNAPTIPDRRLNIGPCLSYAVARVAAVPLLFKDEALARTDIEPAWRP